MSDAGDYLPRHLDAVLERAVAHAPIVILDGPRGAGKTTTAARLAASSVLLPRDLDLLTADATAYLQALPSPTLVDEWQLAGVDLLWILKRLVDDDPTPGRFLLTGSVEPATYGPTYPLTARAARLVLRPMTSAELAGNGARATFLDRVLGGEDPPLGADVAAPFDLQSLLRPGFPGARHVPEPRPFLDAYLNMVSHRAGEEGRDATRMLRAMRVLATLTGAAVPDQRIWDAADINKVTWKHYDDLLHRVHLTASLPAAESNRLKRITAYPKRFFADTAMALAAADIGPAVLRANPATTGPFVESYVMQQLRPQVDLVGGALMHVRTGAGQREVDGIIEVGSRWWGVEVKASRRPTVADARHLAWLRDQLGERFAQGWVVHTGADCYPLGERLYAVPLGVVAGS